MPELRAEIGKVANHIEIKEAAICLRKSLVSVSMKVQ